MVCCSLLLFRRFTWLPVCPLPSVKTNVVDIPIQIEPLERRHAVAMQRLVCDPLVTHMTPKPEPYPDGEAAREIAQAIADREAGSAYCFAILADGEFVGVCKLKEVTPEQGELGYWIGVPFWGMGIATCAADHVLQFAFLELKLNRVVAHTMAENPASARVLEKLGFEFVVSKPNTHPKWSPDEIVLQYALANASP